MATYLYTYRHGYLHASLLNMHIIKGLYALNVQICFPVNNVFIIVFFIDDVKAFAFQQ